jgi:exocyst complex protein 7
VTDLLTSLGDRNWLMGAQTGQQPRSGGEDGILQHFIADLLSALISSLDNRSRSMRKPVSSIYMLNNLSYMRNNLILSNQSAANDIMGSTAEDILNSAYRDAKARYLDAWRELVGLLAEPTSSGRFGVVGVGGDKQAVKDSLANFFNRLDELEVLSRQHTLSRQDPNLRERLHADVRNLVVPAFQSYMAKKHAEKCESFRLCKGIEVSLNEILHIAQIRNRHRPTSRIALLR